MVHYWNVALLSAPFSTLTYGQPDHFDDTDFEPGQRVLVPLGKSIRMGVLIKQVETPPAGVTIRDLLWPAERSPLLPFVCLSMVVELAKRNLVHVGEILGTVLPAGLRQTSGYVSSCTGSKCPKLSLQSLRNKPPKELAELARLWRRNELNIELGSRKRTDPVMGVTLDPPWPIRPAAVRQQMVMDMLWEKGAMSRRMLSSFLGSWVPGVLQTLEEKGLIQVEIEDAPDRPEEQCSAVVPSHAPTLEQTMALKRLRQDLSSPSPKVSLLFGVTGSGKTLVYFELARSCLEQGRDVLILAPEVALGLQLRRLAGEFFHDSDLYFHHGYQTPEVREQTFRSISAAEGPSLVIGTRSALFLPLKNPGLIVLDEEHDESFKQDERFVYQAKEMAYFITQQGKGLLVMGSATPDMKTYYAAMTDKVPVVNLRERIGNCRMPEVELVNLLHDPQVYGPFSKACHEQLQQTVQNGDQAIVMLNRRGYAPLVYCTACGEVARCPQCDVGLTYHKVRERLLCHYCGLTRPFPMVCEKCGGSQYLPLGEGTEQVEEYLSSSLGQETSVLRLDRDSARRKGRMESILGDFSRGEAQVLIGTQMLSKGHHFPGVTLVVVVDGDLGLNLPDYRATERTFQLLVQVSGRAGRGDKPGKVLIQSRNPDHYCWKFITSNDYQGFFERELELRRKLRYPPFVKLGLLRLSIPREWEQGAEAIKNIAARLRARAAANKVLVLGPAPAPISQLRGRLRYHCLVKGETWGAVRSVCAEVIASGAGGEKLRARLDLDPLQML